MLYVFSFYIYKLGMSSALDTLCGQAFGAKKYYMLGIYMQRSWVVLSITGVMFLALFLFVTPILKFFGQTSEIAELAGVISLWLIPTHLAYIFYLPMHFFLQSQLKNNVTTWVSLLGLLVHAYLCWLVVNKFHLGVIALVAFGNIAWWLLVLGYFGYVICGGCTLTWTGFSIEAFSGVWEFSKLSTASGIMIWYIFLSCNLIALPLKLALTFIRAQKMDPAELWPEKILLQIDLDRLNGPGSNWTQ